MVADFPRSRADFLFQLPYSYGRQNKAPSASKLFSPSFLEPFEYVRLLGKGKIKVADEMKVINQLTLKGGTIPNT